MLKLHNFILEKMSESAHDFDILMNDGSTRSMSHYKEKFSFGRFQTNNDNFERPPQNRTISITLLVKNLKIRDPQFLLWMLPPYEV